MASAADRGEYPERVRRPRLAAVLAHPDDESRILGGTLALLAQKGWRLALFCATRGEAGDPSSTPDAVAELRQTELESACRTLCITHLQHGRLPDGEVAKADREAVVEEIVRFFRRFQPDVVVTFGSDGRDGHPDHAAVGSFADEAFRRSGYFDTYPEHRSIGLGPWKPARLYHVAIARSWAQLTGWRGYSSPDDELLEINVGAVLDRKRHAVTRDHGSQWRLHPWNLSTGWVARSVEHFRLVPGTNPTPGDEDLL